MSIRDLFLQDVTRDIPPVVYFHEQTPDKLAAEVREYIVTGGWPEQHPNHKRVPSGIHEQYVRLLTGIVEQLDKPGGPELPTAWISGFYGSGKSSFAKILGLALDGVELPDGRSLAEAWLERDTSPRADELRTAWAALRQRVDPIAVVFDVGGVARDNEHIHSAVLRQVQRRLGYCATEPLVADFELKLERDGRWEEFVETASRVLGRPWDEVKDEALAEEEFSLVLHELMPEHYTDPMSWFTSRAGTHQRNEAPEEAVAAIRDMLRFRRPDATLFVVVDEVSQYVLSHKDRVDRLRVFASALGARLEGRVWFLGLGQQKLDDESGDDAFLVWMKDRFPPRLRVHLAPTNIRDVVHKRLLQKKPPIEAELRTLFESHRTDLKLYAYGTESITPDEFVEVYPMLPGHIDLLLQLTSALRTRSARAQGDDQAIRGLLQLLGELFRDQGLADAPVGTLVTLDRIYDVQHTALDADVQNSMARVLGQCEDPTLARAAKAVALLELVQDTTPTDARLVARCLYDRVDRGSNVEEVTAALEELRRQNLLGYSEKHGYKIQSSAGEEWERERRDIGVGRETIGEAVQEALKYLLQVPERPKLKGRPFPWAGRFSDGRRFDDAVLLDPRDEAAVLVDLRFLTKDERTDSTWIKRSDETALRDRLLWIAGDTDQVDHHARELARSTAMVRKYKPRRESLNPARRMLLQQEENRAEDLGKVVREAVAEAWMAGRLYFRGRALRPADLGGAFGGALHQAGTRILPDLFPSFVATQVQPSELMQLAGTDLAGISPRFLPGELGILELDGGKYVPTCAGVVPRGVQEYLEAEGGLGGTLLLAHFGGPPFGYTANVVKACVLGLLRAGRIKVQPESGAEITAVRDPGTREIFEKDRAFRRASFFPAGDDDIGFQSRARICKVFETELDHPMDREDHVIADAAAQLLPRQSALLRDVVGRLAKLPGHVEPPPELVKLQDVLEQCLRNIRQTKPTVQALKRNLDALRDGIRKLRAYAAELTPEAVEAVQRVGRVRDNELRQLRELDALPGEQVEAAVRVDEQLASERPWRDVRSLDADVAAIVDSYRGKRRDLLAEQERKVEAARGRVKTRRGFSTLTADQAHKVLAPLRAVVMATSEDAIAPSLRALVDPFTGALARAEERANEILDEILSVGPAPQVVKVDLNLRNREIGSEPEVEALVDEIRERLLVQVREGKRVRLG